MKYDPLSESDRAGVQDQLGRELRGEVRVGSRCPFNKVEVIGTSPFIDGGTPFPTLFWLTCPLLQSRVSRLESLDFRQGLIRKLEEDQHFALALREAEREYCDERRLWAEEMGAGEADACFSDRKGIGGTRSGGVKCLHAHLAHFLAGHDNPVGAEVAHALGDCQLEDCEGDCEPFTKRRAR
jgi:hypothetical protein